MEERLENVDKAGNSKHAALYLPSQLINEHKGRKVEDVFLADQPSKTTADLDVKDVAISAPFPDTHGRSESTTPDAQRELTESTTEDVRDKCLPISEELCEVATLNDQPDYLLASETHTYSEPDLCEICGQQYDQELVDKFVHCQVCCKSSGEQKACNSALSDVWQKPQSVPSKESEIDLDSHHEDHQETSTDDQRPQREEAELRPSLQPLEVYSSDVQQNPNSARQTPGNVFAITPSSPPNSRRPNPVRSSLTAMSCSSLCVAEKTSGFRTRLRTHAPCDRYSCRQCGKSFTHWNKLWLHQGLHREKRFMFSCTQCNCKFRFFGSYREHMNEHAAQRPYACPLCPNAYVVEEDLNAHLCKNHQPSRSPACDTCGKWFSSLRNLERHRLLHTGAISHYCLPCRLPFPSNQALRDHLQSHEGRPVIPLPHGSLEPLRFPHRCRKCNGRFTTTEFLRSHQVCHSRHDGNTFSSLANIVSSSLTYKLSNEHAERVVFSPQKRPCLSTSTKKHLYRYRNPDRLYVVPKIVSQPPVTISDTEEDSPSISNSSSPSVLSRNTVLLEYEEQTGPRNDRCEASPCRPSQPSPPSSCILIHVPTPTVPDGTPIQTHTSRSSCQTMNVQTPRGAKFAGDDDAFFRASKQIVMQGGKDPQFGGYECADCSVTFGDISELHEHYLHHARGVK
ncbi:hypothetical protein DPEC_G00203540 [Dallia pectoralis]|uniref:Uncharacterized protein n=1 Tax=Dallia pectoralis TaxID=75939 RepID=A0ACC2G971_DALPE|nr:hypothetical protein DPEC_G00203540 [Dallia pectoralis]